MKQVQKPLGPAKLVLLFLTVWVGCGLAGTLAAWAADHSNQRLYAALKEQGVVVGATVTRIEPSNHNTVYYSFVVSGVTYSSSGPSWPPNPEASQLTVGGSVYVVYDATHPTASCACDPYEAAKSSEWWRRLIAGMFLGTVVAIVITVGLAKRRAPVNDSSEPQHDLESQGVTLLEQAERPQEGADGFTRGPP